MCLISSISSVLCWWVVGSVFQSSDVLISSLCVGGSLKLFQFFTHLFVSSTPYCRYYPIIYVLIVYACYTWVVLCMCMALDERVSYCEWVAPIVPVPKKDREVRIRGEYIRSLSTECST